ncbi:acyltransferase [Calidifontibacter sp. DB0510]|uniref:Acyltransferase n=1 Tax=Metallococcus carri TaxID=1656884 RepID=A0A967B0D2_9MICO|nr:acyltransferase family protein [Metallococcus carri]NHN56466.1 acyltransferase [Metallococcus carri]NOP36090.1 acyltransferase [Calidifontibacter sp. DB2511S]
MPRPVDRNATYYPGLDGVRTLAVAVVILYHLGIDRFSGGLLGVGVFFTLSGFLITSILLSQWRRSGTLGLKTFWIRRARRLLPAVILVLFVGMTMVLLVDRERFGTRAVEALAALFYVANWHTIVSGKSYFDRFSGPGPFDHLWSLSVEEQFYLVWPLLLAALIIVCRGRQVLVAAATTVLAGGSFWLLSQLAQPGFDNTRAYEATDTRAGGLLLGAVLALLWRPHRMAPGGLGRGGRTLVDVAGFVGLAGVIAMCMFTSDYTMSLYQWGLIALSVATCALLVAVCTSGTVLSRLFAWAPLRWLGERSYGIYLWHLPVLAFTPAKFAQGNAIVRDLVLVAITIILAALSWALVENPIRRHGFLGALRRARQGIPDRRSPGVGWGTAVFIPSAVLALILPQAFTFPSMNAASAARAEGAAANSGKIVAEDAPKPSASATPAPSTSPVSTRTSCSKVVYIGDSTSEGLQSPNYLPNPADRIKAQLQRVGVTTFYPEISGARSIIETWQGQPNAQSVADKYLTAGYNGCWILALGTNDAANLYTGGADYPTRIAAMMSKIPSDQPVLWVNTKSLVKSGYYSAAHNVDWSNSLQQACAQYPNMRVYDWASEVQDQWFIDDNIHFNTPGYRERSRRIAHALAVGVPARGASPKACLVSSGLPSA